MNDDRLAKKVYEKRLSGPNKPGKSSATLYDPYPIQRTRLHSETQTKTMIAIEDKYSLTM